MTADDVDAGMARGVFELADRRQQVDIRAMRPQLIANRVGTCLVFLTRWVHGGNADQTSGKINDLVSRAVDFGNYTVA